MTHRKPLPNRLRWSIGGVLLAVALLIVVRAVWLLSGVGGAYVINDTIGTSSAQFEIDRAVPFWMTDACINATWQTDGIDRIYFDGRGTIGAHTETRCLNTHGTAPLVWRVHYGDNVWRTYTLHAVPVTWGTVVQVALLVGVALWVAARPITITPLQSAATVRDFAPYLLPLLLPLVFLWWTDAASINFGWHWDEITLVNQVRRTFNEGTLIPDFYNYPSLSFGLMLLALLRNPSMLFSGDLTTQLQIMEENEYWHFARLLFLTVSVLAVVWVYVLALVWRRNVWVALLSAFFLATSWEVAYHLRYIAPDGLLMSFGALTFLLTVSAYLFRENRFVFWGAVMAAGFAVGSKYPGGLIILPVFIVGMMRWWGQSPLFILGRLVRFGVVFVLAYLVTTPGTLFNFPAFWYDVTHEIAHYGDMGQGYYTIEPGLHHLTQLALYLGIVSFSQAVIIGGFVFALTLIGAVGIVRQDWRLGAIVLLFPVLYVLYFSTQRVMYVRNMLVTMPYWSVMAGVGAVMVWRGLRRWPLQIVWAGILAAAIGYNVGWQMYSTQTILQRGTTYDPPALVMTARDNPDMRYWAAEGLFDALSEQYGDDLPRNIQAEANGADMLAIYHSKNLLIFDSNYGGYIGSRLERPYFDEIQHFGPYEVNFSYYPGWDGDNRIVLIPMAYVAENKQGTVNEP